MVFRTRYRRLTRCRFLAHENGTALIEFALVFPILVVLFLVVLSIGLALTMLLSLYRLLHGPTLWDRLSGLGLIGTKTIVLLLLLGRITGREDIFVDITLSYTLISFIGSLALAKYFEGKETRG